METYFPKIPLSFEIYDTNPLRYMAPKPPKDFWDQNPQLYPKFYSGQVFMNNLMDKVMSNLPTYDTN